MSDNPNQAAYYEAVATVQQMAAMAITAINDSTNLDGDEKTAAIAVIEAKLAIAIAQLKIDFGIS